MWSSGPQRGTPRRPGPPEWRQLHVFAINYPEHPTTADKAATWKALWAFFAQLACAECRYHALRHAAAFPPALANTYTFQAWVWKFHNRVNRRLGKPFVPYHAYMALYADELETANRTTAGPAA